MMSDHDLLRREQQLRHGTLRRQVKAATMRQASVMLIGFWLILLVAAIIAVVAELPH